MSRILLADDSPHAQRMGERILREEGFEVVTVTDGDTAIIRLADVDPDVILADVRLPRKSGYELCEYIKKTPKHAHARVVLLAGLLEPVDDGQAQRVRADGVLKKPFEATAMLATVKPLAEAASNARPGASNSVKPRVAGSILGLSGPASRPLPKPAVVVEEVPKLVIPKILQERAARLAEQAAEPDTELIRAAVTVALDRAMPTLIDEITDRVLEALRP